MIHTLTSRRGMVTAPHHLASQAGLAVLREGGNAIEAAVAASAAISVLYPHMSGIGGDAFWIAHRPGDSPVFVEGCGAAGMNVRYADYQALHAELVPNTGTLSAFTVAGAVSSWSEILEVSREWDGRLPPARLLEDAIHYAKKGFPISRQLTDAIAAQMKRLQKVPGYLETYAPGGRIPKPGEPFRSERLGASLERLASHGLADFYQGELAEAIAADLQEAGIALTLADLRRHRALRVAPRTLAFPSGMIYTTPPPTQGVAALMILGALDRLDIAESEGFDFVHGIVEATKQSFLIRNAHVGDPVGMTADADSWLCDAALRHVASKIDRARASPWPRKAVDSDTIWLGACDANGRSASVIQSVFMEFGSGVVLPSTGILWQNRAAGFSLAQSHPNQLRPGRKPFHTLCPVFVRFKDGRSMMLGARGADGQPQTLAAVFTRYARLGQTLQEAVSAPRWRLGYTGASVLGIESRFGEPVLERLAAAGHDLKVAGPYENFCGHAGAVVCHDDGLLEAAIDPRSDGVVAAY